MLGGPRFLDDVCRAASGFSRYFRVCDRPRDAPAPERGYRFGGTLLLGEGRAIVRCLLGG